MLVQDTIDVRQVSFNFFNTETTKASFVRRG